MPTQTPATTRARLSFGAVLRITHYSVLQSVPGHGPEQEGQSCDACGYKHADPYCASYEELLDVRLAYGKSTEGCRLGLAEEYKDWVEFVLM